jgi:hypothetical protein
LRLPFLSLRIVRLAFLEIFTTSLAARPAVDGVGAVGALDLVVAGVTVDAVSPPSPERLSAPSPPWISS